MLSPFVYKISENSDFKEGVFRRPNFCNKKCHSAECVNFYAKLKVQDGIKKCPHGYVAEKFAIGNALVYFSSLSVEGYSDINEIKKKNGKPNVPIHLSFEEYNRLKQLFIINYDSRSMSSNELSNLKENIEDTFHEIRNLNKQLKDFSSQLSKEVVGYDENNTIVKLNTDIYSISNLMSIRLDSYDLLANPDLNLFGEKVDIPIFRRVEKIYKCLIPVMKEKNVSISRFNGNSHKYFKGSPSIELALFIILENAVKYSAPNRTIDISFREEKKNLIVEIGNYGVLASEEDEKHWLERGYRGENARKREDNKGRGLGLFVLDRICRANSINLNISPKKKKQFTYNNIDYAYFKVTLTFPEVYDLAQIE